MRRRFLTLTTLPVLLAVLAAGTAIAAGVLRSDDGAVDSASDVHGRSHHQHGGTDGHLMPTSSGVDLVGKARINQDVEGRVSDVGVLGNYAYLGAFNTRDCQKGGTYVFDISNPAVPKQINFIRAQNDAYVGEGVQALRIDTPQFTGDVLAQNLEICGVTKTGAQGGFNLFDVTNPKSHKLLSHVGDYLPAGTNGASVAHTYHSVFMWDAGDKAYAVGVDNEEAEDIDIYDISNPRVPTLVAEYDLNRETPQIIDSVKGASESFLHDMVVKNIGGRWIMLASYWDGGYVKLDVTGVPAEPVYLADSDFPASDPLAPSYAPEGNAHQAEFSNDNEYIVAADEDFDPYSLRASNTTDATTFSAGQGSDTPKLVEGDSVAGQTVFVGRACPGDPAVPVATAENQVAVVERGACDFTVKVAAVDAANGASGPDYAAALVVNRTASDGCESTTGMSVAGNTMTFGVTPRSLAYDLFNISGYDEAQCKQGDGTQLLPIALGATGDSVAFESYFDGWGYVRLFRNGEGKLSELDQFALPEAHNPAYASGFGDLSVHEVAMSAQRSDLAYLSYYAGGLRVLKIDGDELTEVGSFIENGGNNFWGVEVFSRNGKEYVAASDRDFGLYIFEYTGSQ